MEHTKIQKQCYLFQDERAKTVYRDPSAVCDRLALGVLANSHLLEFDSAQDDTEGESKTISSIGRGDHLSSVPNAENLKSLPL